MRDSISCIQRGREMRWRKSPQVILILFLEFSLGLLKRERGRETTCPVVLKNICILIIKSAPLFCMGQCKKEGQFYIILKLRILTENSV